MRVGVHGAGREGADCPEKEDHRLVDNLRLGGQARPATEVAPDTAKSAFADSPRGSTGMGCFSFSVVARRAVDTAVGAFTAPGPSLAIGVVPGSVTSHMATGATLAEKTVCVPPPSPLTTSRGSLQAYRPQSAVLWCGPQSAPFSQRHSWPYFGAVCLLGEQAVPFDLSVADVLFQSTRSTATEKSPSCSRRPADGSRGHGPCRSRCRSAHRVSSHRWDDSQSSASTTSYWGRTGCPTWNRASW